MSQHQPAVPDNNFSAVVAILESCLRQRYPDRPPPPPSALRQLQEYAITRGYDRFLLARQLVKGGLCTGISRSHALKWQTVSDVLRSVELRSGPENP